MGIDAFMTGYSNFYAEMSPFSDQYCEDESLGQMGHDSAPFFLPPTQAVNPNHSLEDVILFDSELLLAADTEDSFSIPSFAKDIVSIGLLASAVCVESAMLVPIGIASGLAGIANILRLYAEPGTLTHQFSDFTLKVNKVMFFSVSAIVSGAVVTDLIGSGVASSIIGSGIASILNSAYNIVEESIEYSLIPPPPGKFPTTGIDKHSCVNYENGNWELTQLATKVSNKMLGRTSKELTKAIAEMLLADNDWLDPIYREALLETPLSFTGNLASNLSETGLNSGFKDFSHHMERDLLAALSKTISKTLLEGLHELHFGKIPTPSKYIISALTVLSSVLVRTFYDGNWDPYLPEWLSASKDSFHESTEIADVEDFENES